MYVAIVAACSEIVWGLHPKQYHNDDKHFHIFCENCLGPASDAHSSVFADSLKLFGASTRCVFKHVHRLCENTSPLASSHKHVHTGLARHVFVKLVRTACHYHPTTTPLPCHYHATTMPLPCVGSRFFWFVHRVLSIAASTPFDPCHTPSPTPACMCHIPWVSPGGAGALDLVITTPRPTHLPLPA